MTEIVEYACPDLLRTLRLVSRWTRDEVDLRLARHICATEDREGTAFLSLQFDTTDTSPRIMYGASSAKVLDLDLRALAHWAIWKFVSKGEARQEAATGYLSEKLLVRYHMRDLASGPRRSYVWRPARRSVHFVDVPGFFYGLHARSAAYAKSGEGGNSTVFHVSYDLRRASNWEFRIFGVRRVHNRGLTLVFSRDDTRPPATDGAGGGKPHIVLLRLLDRVVENYAETGDALTLVGVEGWDADLVPSPRDMVLNYPATGWSDTMPMQAKIGWWATHNARSVPGDQWTGGRRDTPHAAVRFRSLAEWREELGAHVFDLMMDPGAIYWGP